MCLAAHALEFLRKQLLINFSSPEFIFELPFIKRIALLSFVAMKTERIGSFGKDETSKKSEEVRKKTSA